jgi:hypothetical protein
LPQALDTVENYWLIILISGILAALTFDFVRRFFLPARRLTQSLAAIHSSLRDATAKSQQIVDLEVLVGPAKSQSNFSSLWSEYAKTLHAQRGLTEFGENRVLRWRATALAETFFTDHALVDSPLRTEYFKHLPGILTGLGIIGTFGGLIRGLEHFNVSLSPELVQAALGSLIRAVGHAFFVSAIAISLAMFLTWAEKITLSNCYRLVEDIQADIDNLCHAGVGEEYLERLVRASETSATQALHIKDALVEDLKQILTEVTNRQVEASARDSSQISTDVGKVIADSLGPPIERISLAVERVGSTQGDAINTMLVDVLAQFSGQMEKMFGGQMKGVSDLLLQTTEAMQNTASRFERLATNMDSAGKSAADAMSERLTEAVTSMEARQQLLNHQMSEFVDQIRTLVSQSQTETAEKLQSTLSQLGEQIISVVGQLQSQAHAASERASEQGDRFANQTGQAISGLSREVELLLKRSSDISASLQTSVNTLASSTNDSITRMNSGAELLYVASSDFAKAGVGVTASLSGSSAAIEQIKAASASISLAMEGAVSVLADYRNNREAFANIVSDLKSTIQNAKKEAFMTSDLIEKLQAAASQLQGAQVQSEQYLKGVTEVLTKAHEAFAASVERTLQKGNSQFHTELANAVNLLSSGIQDLGDTLETVSAKR